VLPPGGALAGRLFSRLLGDDHDDPPLAPGTRVGDWRIGAMLGCGGSSTVYLADRDDGHFDQQAAIKIVRRHPRLIAQFRRERQILADLRHPAIAQLIDGGEIEDGRLWFAMEPVFGEPIDQHVRNRRLPMDERLALFEAVCDAVAYAHRRQLIHRDIKPGNLLVDETDRPRLLDFGIASSDDEDEESGDRAMTPIYASPEQQSGGIVTVASDIFQLGVLLRMLSLPDGAPCETLPRKPRAIVRRELAAVIACATAMKPEHRYATAQTLGADVAGIRKRHGVSVIGGVRYPIARFLQRHAVLSAIIGVA
jgi:serine/threonine protein kinase